MGTEPAIALAACRLEISLEIGNALRSTPSTTGSRRVCPDNTMRIVRRGSFFPSRYGSWVEVEIQEETMTNRVLLYSLVASSLVISAIVLHFNSKLSEILNQPTVKTGTPSTVTTSNTPRRNTITVNSVVIKDGQTIVVHDNKIIVDGKDVTPDTKEIHITVSGRVEHLTADICNQISITGDTGSVSTQTGNIKVDGNVNSCVRTISGNVHAKGKIVGNISTVSGDIQCGGE